MARDEIVKLTNIGINFDGRWVFRNLSLTVSRGESIVILGTSGSGKSVLLKIIAGLIQPTEGSILVGKNIGMLFQQNALFDSLTAEENLLMPLEERLSLTGEKAKEKAMRFLFEVGLDGCSDLFPDELSGGMQKRLGVARALIVSPDLLLYDEPTAGLDPVTSRHIADLIIRLKEETGSTLITITNEVQRAYQIGERIFLLADGGLRGGGSPGDTRTSRDQQIHHFVTGGQDK